MSATVSKPAAANISELIHRVACSCLSNRMPNRRELPFSDFSNSSDDLPSPPPDPAAAVAVEAAEEEDGLKIWEEDKNGLAAAATTPANPASAKDKVQELEALMSEVFDAVSAVRRAYAGMQDAHCPWDPDRMRTADAAVVVELRNLARLRDRYRRYSIHSTATKSSPLSSPASLKEAVAPYEAALDDLKKQLMVKEAEVENLKEKLHAGGRNGTTPRRRCRSAKHPAASGNIASHPGTGAATPELFVSCMEQVKSATRSLTNCIIHLMRAARCDIAAAVRSVVAAAGNEEGEHRFQMHLPDIDPRDAKYALEAYISRRLFQGFEHETFYLDGSLSALLRPADYRRDCFVQFRDMRTMDPAELLGILPQCLFGRFAAKRYLSVVHAGVEKVLFGSVEQRRQVESGAHPRTTFYGEFLRAAKAVWLLHLLAFALDPPPSHFEAGQGAEYHAEYMESVAANAGGAVVGFAVSPGFRLGNGAVVRARVFLVPRGAAR